MAKQHKYDVVIVGGGLGGLLCAVLLAKEGRKVCVLEKNKQVGGCLQTFALHRKVFDSCVHYIGGLGKGHTLHRILSYAGIMDRLDLKPFDPDSFDRIAFGNEPEEYPQAAGKEHFISQLLRYFPGEEQSLRRYVALIEDTTRRFPMYHLQNGDSREKAEVAQLELSGAIARVTDHPVLAAVLAGNNLLYAGVRGKTPFYVHALVMESYLHSVHKVMPGSSQIAKCLVQELRRHGGELLRNIQVQKLEEEHGKITCALSAAGERYYADHFIAAVHPALLSGMLDHRLLRPAFHRRIDSLEQTMPAFMVNLVLQPGRIPFRQYNLYWHASKDAFAGIDATAWPATYALYYSEDESHPGYADRLSVVTYMPAGLTDGWRETVNHTGSPSSRGKDYDLFKVRHAGLLIRRVAERLPGLEAAIVASSTATPLTFRDYTGSPDGSMYGILKDVGAAARTSVNTRTRVENLYLTGQNVNLHGVLGVSVTAVMTAGELVGLDYLLDRIHAAP